jgi:ribosome-associated heat shock protein Hsp15
VAGVGGDRQRVDKWLHAARFFKTRPLAVALVEAGRLRIKSARVRKPGHAVALGDVLTFPQGNTIRVVRVLAPALRRGPATEARTLYEDLSPGESGPDDAASGGQGHATAGPD